MRPAHIFRFSLLSFVSGIFAGSFLASLSPVIPLLVAALGAAFFGAWPDRRGAALLILCGSFAFGFAWVGDAERYWSEDRAEGNVTGIAEVVRKPEEKDLFRNVVVRFSSCETDPCSRDLVSVRMPLSEDVAYGDSVRLSCAVSVPEEEWRMYYAKEGIGLTCRSGSWEKLSGNGSVAGRLIAIAGRFEESLTRSLPEPESSLATGLLLGGDGRLPAEVKDDFRAAGLAHIVAVSGYNISIIAGYFLLLGIAAFLPRQKAVIFALAGTLAFVFVSGAPPSAIRAIGMAGALMLSWWLGRRYTSVWAILFAASLMLLWNPLLLRHDLGFILSFFATIGIAFLSPVFQRMISSFRYGKFFAEALLLTIAAELFILPVIFMNFGTFSFMTFPANAALLPLVPVAMLLSFLAGVFGMMLPALGTIAAFPAYAVLHTIIAGASYAASFEEATIVWDGFGWAHALLWYALLAAGLFAVRHFRRAVFRTKAELPRL